MNENIRGTAYPDDIFSAQTSDVNLGSYVSMPSFLSTKTTPVEKVRAI